MDTVIVSRRQSRAGPWGFQMLKLAFDCHGMNRTPTTCGATVQSEVVSTEYSSRKMFCRATQRWLRGRSVKGWYMKTPVWHSAFSREVSMQSSVSSSVCLVLSPSNPSEHQLDLRYDLVSVLHCVRNHKTKLPWIRMKQHSHYILSEAS